MDHSNFTLSPFLIAVSTREDGQYFFSIIDAATEVELLYSKTFASESICTDMARRLIACESHERRFEVKQTQKGQHYIVLKMQGNKETGRSPLFDTPDQVKNNMDKLKKLSIDTPVIVLGETQQDPPKPPQPAPVAAKKSELVTVPNESNAAQMLRYKFSLIYYPDSGLWTLKNDFSSATEHLKDCNGALIEQFLRSQLPEAKSTPPPPATTSAYPGEPSRVKMEKPPQILELWMEDKDGAPLSVNPLLQPLDIFNIHAKSTAAVLEGIFDAQLTIKSISDPNSRVSGPIYNLEAENGRLVIPVSSRPDMPSGTYIITVQLSNSKQCSSGIDFYGSVLIVVN